MDGVLKVVRGPAIQRRLLIPSTHGADLRRVEAFWTFSFRLDVGSILGLWLQETGEVR